MAVLRENPYGGFAFLVSLGGADPKGAAGGFSRVRGLERRVELLRYRAGNDPALTPRLVPGLAVNPVITFERGVIGDLELHEWMTTAVRGQPDRRDLRIDLQSEDLAGTVQSWLVLRALPPAFHGPTLDAMANEVAIVSLTVVAEGIEVE
jgi:phage tail-like protein